MQKILSLTLVSLFTLSMLTACGFHLRESYQLPTEFTPVSLDVPREYREFGFILDEEMQRSSIPLVSASQAPSLLVRLSNVSETEELLTASATGSPLERKVILKAKVYWENAQGVDVLPSEEFSLQRTFVYDDTAVLAKRREADSLMRELERELSRRIILRMRQLSK